MGDPKGFMNTGREVPKRRPVDVRIKDWREVYEPQSFEHLQKQAGRCMDCGIPFCHNGCPLGNLIPEWNDLIFRGDKEEAINRLHATNNFPEFTGRLCPAPCETACVVAINRDAVTIKQIELRVDDNEETIRNRIKIYNDSCTNLLAFYKNKVIIINASLHEDAIFSQISTIINA